MGVFFPAFKRFSACEGDLRTHFGRYMIIFVMNKLTMQQDKGKSQAENPERRELIERFGKFAAYAAPFTVLAFAQKADAATGTGPGKHVVHH